MDEHADEEVYSMMSRRVPNIGVGVCHPLPVHGCVHKPGSSQNAVCMHAKSLQSRAILCDPMNCRQPGASVHRILQARILEWIAMPSSRESS